jgi:D-xylose transport system substrate-binding protein
MSKKFIGAVAGLAAASLLVAACSSSSDSGTESSAPAEATAAASEAASEAMTEEAVAAGGKACVILPDAASSARWETADRPFLEEAFTAAGVEYDIQNANGDKAKFATIADGMLASGCGVLAIVNLDSETGSAVIAKATAAGVPVIDYDRLTLGGGAQYYVSFDNVAVGTAIGEGLVKCLNDAGITEGPVAYLNGSPTDNNATLFKEGYAAALEGAGFTPTADQSVPDWDNTKAGTIFEQMYTEANGDFVAVAAANDGLGGAVIAVLDRNGQAGKIFVSGQDATDEGLQRVLLGTQCVTVYKAVKKEAQAAADLAIALLNGDQATADALATGSTTDSEAGTEVPSVLLTPQPIFPDTVKDVIADGFTTVDKVCATDELKAACAEYGVQ